MEAEAACIVNVIDKDSDELTGIVTITGDPYVGKTLTAYTGRLGGSGTITYEWKRGDSKIGTNSNTYAVTQSDIGSTITITASREDNEGSVTSAAIGPITTLVTLQSVTANGSANETTTQLTLTFSQAITGLSANDITLGGVSVQKGILSGSVPSYILEISGFSAGGPLTVKVEKSGYTINDSIQTVTIYYIISVTTYTVTYDYNGIGGGLTETPVASGTLITLGDGLIRAGFTFDGWTINEDGIGTTYAAGESYKVNGNVTFYAKWIATNGIVGGGTSDNPYLVRTVEEMYYVGRGTSGDYQTWDRTKYYKLETDITLTNSWIPIYQNSSDTIMFFSETFDGNGHTIDLGNNIVGDVKYSYAGNNDMYAGLFSKIEDTGKVKNLVLKGSITLNDTSNHTTYAGGVAGHTVGTISNVSSSVNVTINDGTSIKFTGGIVGYSNMNTITNCYSTGVIKVNASQTTYSSGIGNLYSGSITNCWSSSLIESKSSANYKENNAGGIAAMNSTGNNINPCTVKNCVALNPNITVTYAIY